MALFRKTPLARNPRHPLDFIFSAKVLVTLVAFGSERLKFRRADDSCCDLT